MDLEELEVVKGCSSELAAAVSSFRDNVTVSHTTRSRRWSIWSAVKAHLDSAAKQALCNQGLQNPFVGDSFSDFMKKRDLKEADIHLSAICKPYSNTDLVFDIDVLRGVLRFCHSCAPSHQESKFFAKQRTTFGKNKPRSLFCELCWRKTQGAVELNSGEPYTLASMRFCEEHDPSKPHSLYRTDHNKRKLFDDNIRKLKRTGYYYNILEPKQKEHLRWVAYKLARLNIRDYHFRLFDMILSGQTQSSIASHFGVSRQSVSRNVAKYKDIALLWEKLNTSHYPTDPEGLEAWESLLPND
ncbi:MULTISPECIES: hypothetical protein [Halomonadaceae]|uniref:hypothetical protein n=1 Tax=Halomonadaceae TaxID=28256 RepID=UPI001599A678|nr:MULTISPECIES: hypothetical protein [Halomonas]QJQ94825.1 hypothetical protein HIO72_05700 [Halomonas sp. PA5]